MRARLAWAIGGFVALAFAWNGFAARFGEQEIGLRRRGDVFERASAHLARTLAEVPPAALPRVAVFGSSQVAVVKSDTVDTTRATPSRLQAALTERGVRTEVVDFSDGGQQLVESLLIELATQEQVRQNAVVVGVSLFSMLRTNVRPTLLADLDGAAMRDELRARMPLDADPKAAEALLAWSRSAEQRVTGRGETIQEQMDDRIGAWFAAHTSAFANRQAMFDALIDRPLRRDLVRIVSRGLHDQSTAQTYVIGSAYAPSLLALEILQRRAREAGGTALVVALPYDDTRPPIPFAPETQARILADLAALTARTGGTLLDLSHALPSDRFGAFEDGSPDDLHYDPAGHATVAARIADALAPALAARASR